MQNSLTDFPFFLVCVLLLWSWLASRASWGWSQNSPALTVCLPHGVEDGTILHNAEQLVGRCHVVRNGPLPIAEKSVRCPDLADHQVVEPQDLNGALELKSLVDPGLTEEHIHSVLLPGERKMREKQEKELDFFCLRNGTSSLSTTSIGHQTEV